MATPLNQPRFHCDVTDDGGTRRAFNNYRTALMLAKSIASVYPEIDAEEFARTWNATNESGSVRFAIVQE